MKFSTANRSLFFNIFFAVVFSFPSCRDSVHRVSRVQLGTVLNLTIIADAGTASRAAEAAFTEVERIENLMSPYRPGSDIRRINQQAWLRPVKISSETFALVEQSIDISRGTGGAFDITFPPLGKLWDYKSSDFLPPGKAALAAVLPLVNYRNIKLEKSKKTLFMNLKGMRAGLGALAKGYAVKRALRVLLKKGVSSAIVEAGGDLQVAGTKSGKPWNIGLRHPRNNSFLVSMGLADMESIATSGDYERYVMHNGRRYHHILDPRTGYPAETFSSVSVISKDPVLSDAYATALFVMGKKAIPFLLKHPELSVVFIDLQMKVHASKSLKGRVKPVKGIVINWF